MSAWDLPTSLTICGRSWPIRTDYRAILDILKVYTDPDYEDDERAYVCLFILFPDFEDMPKDIHEEAYKKAIEFIDAGQKGDGGKKPTLMDWEQDAGIIIPAINKVIGTEVRAVQYMHWWTFLGAYMEIGESLFSTIVGIRSKKAKGKKLEKWEREFYKENKSLIDLETRLSEEEIEEKERLKAILK